MDAGLTRRHWLVAGLACGPALAAAAIDPALRLAAAWETAEGAQLGLLRAAGARFRIETALDIPTRAHGLLREGPNQWLAVARRPGDWLLRWHADGRALRWAWIKPDRAFNGHALASADGQRLFTTETDLGTGQGLVGVRDAATLEKMAEWPTHGADPHMLLRHGQDGLIVANGGILTQAETGRSRLAAARTDSSLVRLDARTGALVGQWRLADPELSLRHLAWGAQGKQAVLGIALQAQHGRASEREQAPVLALWDGQRLRTCPAPQALQGYAGDIRFAGGQFVLSCPRTHALARYDAGGRWLGALPLREACALATTPDARVYAGGRAQVLELAQPQAPLGLTPLGLRLDNHWDWAAG